jgi:hypothetical protein
VWLLSAALSGAAASSAAAEDQVPRGAAPLAQPAPEQQATPGAPAAGPATPAAPAASTASPAAPAQPPAANKPGFIEALGRWWKQGSDDFNAKIQDARQKLDEYNKKQSEAAKAAAVAAQEAVKNAATAIVRLPNTRVIEARERCATAANGAPDCQAAAVAACRAKGFNTGQPADVSSSETCATTMWLSGQSRDQAPCQVRTEAIVTRAVCQ